MAACYFCCFTVYAAAHEGLQQAPKHAVSEQAIMVSTLPAMASTLPTYKSAVGLQAVRSYLQEPTWRMVLQDGVLPYLSHHNMSNSS